VRLSDLASYFGAEGDMYQRTAVFLEKILNGAQPAKLPVGQPTKFELVIKVKTAKVLGLEVPPSVLARADEVID
jgi:putative ABC transport system substrate-binding protein